MTFRRRRSTPRRFRVQPLRARRPAVRAALKSLRYAHDLMQSGKYQEAAQAYNALAEGAEKRRLPQAPQLFLQAGRAWFKAGDPKSGLDNLQRGLTIFEQHRKFRRLIVVGSRIQSELDENGFTHEASAIGTFVDRIRNEYDLQDLQISTEIRRSKLPAKCPQCGGSVIPDQVEYYEDGSARCDYCGSLIQRV